MRKYFCTYCGTERETLESHSCKYCGKFLKKINAELSELRLKIGNDLLEKITSKPSHERKELIEEMDNILSRRILRNIIEPLKKHKINVGKFISVGVSLILISVLIPMGINILISRLDLLNLSEGGKAISFLIMIIPILILGIILYSVVRD